MNDLPAPLTPADCDLTDFAFMPVDVRRLRDSDTAAMDDPEGFRAAVILWCVAWHQVPAASLPDDDGALCRLAGYGRDTKTWRRAKEAGALRGFVKCSDGRLYHRVIAEKARESWDKKQGYRDRMEKARTAKKQGKSQDNDTINNGDNPPTITQPITASIIEPMIDTVTGHKGQGQGEGEGQGERDSGSLRSPVGDGATRSPTPASLFAEAISVWNAVCGDVLPKVAKATDARKDTFCRRFRDDFSSDWNAWTGFCRRVRSSPFLTNAEGSNRSGWKADFDFVLEPRNMAKILEGNWDPSNRANAPLDKRMTALAVVAGFSPHAPPDEPMTIDHDDNPDLWRTAL